MDLQRAYAGLHALVLGHREPSPPRDAEPGSPISGPAEGVVVPADNDHPEALMRQGFRRVLASSSTPARRPSSFSGDHRRTQAHSEYLHTCKKLKRAQQETCSEQQAASSLKRAWDEERLRFGDHVGPAEHAVHCNQWSYPQVLRNTWLQLGKNKCIRSGVDGHHRALDIMATVAAAASEDQDD